MQTFSLVWLGQVISLFGSKLTEFAIGVWVYQQTGSITQFGLILVFIYLPNILISPLSGALVDRWNRRTAMMLSATVAGINTLVLMVLLLTSHLHIWHVYIAVLVFSVCEAFQWPAYTAAVAQLIPQKHLSRANGIVQISRAIAKLSAPIMAGFLVKMIQLNGVLLIDSCTYIIAIVTLLQVRFPNLQNSKRRQAIGFQQIQQEIISGWQYISQRAGLVRLLIFVAITYFTMGTLEVVFWPLILSFGSSSDLGMVLSIGGCGMLFGSLLMSVWGGPRKRIYGLFIFVPLQGLLILLGGFRPSLIFAGMGVFGYLFAQPIIVSCNQAIWQSKVPMKLQGRVFALQMMLERSLSVFAYIFMGPLVDNYLEPMMAEDGLLANSIGVILGVGPGRGIGLLLCSVGLLNIVITVYSLLEPRLKNVERELPDVIKSDLRLSKVRP